MYLILSFALPAQKLLKKFLKSKAKIYMKNLLFLLAKRTY